MASANHKDDNVEEAKEKAQERFSVRNSADMPETSQRTRELLHQQLQQQKTVMEEDKESQSSQKTTNTIADWQKVFFSLQNFNQPLSDELKQNGSVKTTVKLKGDGKNMTHPPRLSNFVFGSNCRSNFGNTYDKSGISCKGGGLYGVFGAPIPSTSNANDFGMASQNIQFSPPLMHIPATAVSSVSIAGTKNVDRLPSPQIIIDRKLKKPMMEKKRRDKMNRYFEALKEILLHSDFPQGSKLEKTDVLENTTKFIYALQARLHRLQSEAQENTQASARHGYMQGMQACANAIVHAIDAAPLPLPPHATTEANDLRNYLKKTVADHVSTATNQIFNDTTKNNSNINIGNENALITSANVTPNTPITSTIGITPPPLPSLPSSSSSMVFQSAVPEPQQLEQQQTRGQLAKSPPFFPTPLAKRSRIANLRSDFVSESSNTNSTSPLLASPTFTPVTPLTTMSFVGFTPPPLASQASANSQMQTQQLVHSHNNLAVLQQMMALFNNNNRNIIAPLVLNSTSLVPLGNLSTTSKTSKTFTTHDAEEKENEALIIDVVDDDAQDDANDSAPTNNSNDDSGISSPPSQNSSAQNPNGVWRPY